MFFPTNSHSLTKLFPFLPPSSSPTLSPSTIWHTTTTITATHIYTHYPSGDLSLFCASVCPRFSFLLVFAWNNKEQKEFSWDQVSFAHLLMQSIGLAVLSGRRWEKSLPSSNCVGNIFSFVMSQRAMAPSSPSSLHLFLSLSLSEITFSSPVFRKVQHCFSSVVVEIINSLGLESGMKSDNGKIGRIWRWAQIWLLGLWISTNVGNCLDFYNVTQVLLPCRGTQQSHPTQTHPITTVACSGGMFMLTIPHQLTQSAASDGTFYCQFGANKNWQ